MKAGTWDPLPLGIASMSSWAAAGPGGDSGPDAWESGLGFCPFLWPLMALERLQPPYAGGHKADPLPTLRETSAGVVSS